MLEWLSWAAGTQTGSNHHRISVFSGHENHNLHLIIIKDLELFNRKLSCLQVLYPLK